MIAYFSTDLEERTTILGYARLLFRATIWHRDESPTIKAQPQCRTLRRFRGLVVAIDPQDALNECIACSQ
jgi:hypothetical protein